MEGAATSLRYAYSPPRALAENIWEIRGEWSNKLGRRMTVVRLADGRNVIHNAFALKEKDLAWLASLGTPSFLIAPNIFHCSDAAWMAERFAGIKLFVPASKMHQFEAFDPQDVNKDFPLLPELKCFPMRGARLEEAAFLHTPSRTLILCDLSFHMPDVFTGLEKRIMRWNKVGGRFGPSRLTKLLFTKNKRELVSSYGRLLDEDFDRVVVNHGDVLESGGREKLRAGVAEIFG